MGENVWSIPILASQPNLLWVTLVKTPHCGAGQTAVYGNQSGGKFADNPLFQITVFNWIIAVFDWIIGGCGSLFAGDLDGRDYLRKRMLPSAQICGRKIWAIQRDLNRWGILVKLVICVVPGHWQIKILNLKKKNKFFCLFMFLYPIQGGKNNGSPYLTNKSWFLANLMSRDNKIKVTLVLWHPRTLFF